MKKKGKSRKKEDDSEEWCFVCKDGGDMIICDRKDCFKSYHPECLEDDSVAKSKTPFICAVHKCNACGRTSDMQCYCCPKGVCRRCVKSEDFVHVRGKKGFCSHCLKLALLVEEKKDVDSDGERIDFNNINTYETLFKEYWEIIRATEKLTLENLISTKAQLKSGKNYDSDNYDDSNDENQFSDFEDKDDIEPQDPERKRKKSKAQPSNMKGKTDSNKKFSGWGSTRLMQFLTNIGKDPTHVLSQRELEVFIKGYVKEKKLLQKKRTVECDAWLQSLFGRKTVKLNKIYDLLESHLAENQASSDDDELGYESEDKDDIIDVDDDEKLAVPKKKKKNNAGNILEKEAKIPRFRYAAVVPENIRLVYLRRTLVQKLEKECESLEGKVIGSFVRAKEDANGFFPRHSYQLVQVTGIKKCLVGENDQNVVLQALDMDISINTLSDDDFSEEECQDLRNKVKSGLLKKLTLVELEQKAKSLHQDIVMHWIPRELALLKHRIDQANEKGWRKELFEYLERRQFLLNPTNQSKLLEKVPTVVPDVDEAALIEDDTEDDKRDTTDSPKSILVHTSCNNLKDNETASEEKKHGVHALIAEEKTLASETLAGEGKLQNFFDSLAPKKRQDSLKASLLKDQIAADVDHGTIKTQQSSSYDADKSTIGFSKEELEDTESSQWYVTSPSGRKLGPVSLSVLKNWSRTRAASESKIYKESQTEEQAIPLTAVIHLAFPIR